MFYCYFLTIHIPYTETTRSTFVDKQSTFTCVYLDNLTKCQCLYNNDRDRACKDETVCTKTHRGEKWQSCIKMHITRKWKTQIPACVHSQMYLHMLCMSQKNCLGELNAYLWHWFTIKNIKLIGKIKHNSFGLRMDVIIPTVIPLMFWTSKLKKNNFCKKYFE